MEILTSIATPNDATIQITQFGSQMRKSPFRHSTVTQFEKEVRIDSKTCDIRKKTIIINWLSIYPIIINHLNHVFT